MYHICSVTEKNKTEVVRAYASTMKWVRSHIADIPGMTIIRFIDESIKSKLGSESFFEKWRKQVAPTPEQIEKYKKLITDEQKNAGPANGRPNDSEGSEV